MTFSELNLNKALLNALNDLGYHQPTPIQEKTFAAVMSGKDILGIAQTGTGKTFAYLLPLLRQWQFSKERHPQILVVVPTRELVAQVVTEVEKLTKYMSVVTVGVYGGTNINTQAKTILQGVDVLVGTPGRLLDLSLGGVLKLKSIKKLVIDEVDEMLNLGFRPQLSSIFDLLPTKRQNLLFSATLLEEVELLLDTFFNHPLRIEATPIGTPLENIQQIAYDVPNFYTKVNLLEYLLAHHPEMSKVLVFMTTKDLADQLYEKLVPPAPEPTITDRRQIKQLLMEMIAEPPPPLIGVIHSNKAQNNRFNTVNNFKSGATRVLIATDIIARGIDISEVTHVINFDVPEVPEIYIHRIGRTGRADKQGISITFVTEKDKEYQVAIETLIQQPIPMAALPEDLVISTELTFDELPKVTMKNIQLKIPKIEAGSAYHEKLDKNKKVNIKVTRKDKMHEKYGKPQKRGQKLK
jgi:ATP-dependent RNA helicase RhlE